jgi:hypothetical protein
MKKLVLAIIFLFLCKLAFASYIFNPGTGGGPSTLTDSNGCVWQIGNTVTTGGVIASTLISCPGISTPSTCTPGHPIGLLLALTSCQ